MLLSWQLLFLGTGVVFPCPAERTHRLEAGEGGEEMLHGYGRIRCPAEPFFELLLERHKEGEGPRIPKRRPLPGPVDMVVVLELPLVIPQAVVYGQLPEAPAEVKSPSLDESSRSL
jgi:hypothetical protein